MVSVRAVSSVSQSGYLLGKMNVLISSCSHADPWEIAGGLACVLSVTNIAISPLCVTILRATNHSTFHQKIPVMCPHGEVAIADDFTEKFRSSASKWQRSPHRQCEPLFNQILLFVTSVYNNKTDLLKSK